MHVRVQKKLTLKQLLAKVNENNLHAEVDFGSSVASFARLQVR